jgi:hypothetical protein
MAKLNGEAPAAAAAATAALTHVCEAAPISIVHAPGVCAERAWATQAATVMGAWTIGNGVFLASEQAPVQQSVTYGTQKHQTPTHVRQQLK